MNKNQNNKKDDLLEFKDEIKKFWRGNVGRYNFEKADRLLLKHDADLTRRLKFWRMKNKTKEILTKIEKAFKAIQRKQKILFNGRSTTPLTSPVSTGVKWKHQLRYLLWQSAFLFACSEVKKNWIPWQERLLQRHTPEMIWLTSQTLAPVKPLWKTKPSVYKPKTAMPPWLAVPLVAASMPKNHGHSVFYFFDRQCWASIAAIILCALPTGR